eukprot:5611905-Amphidinium_carterae.1
MASLTGTSDQSPDRPTNSDLRCGVSPKRTHPASSSESTTQIQHNPKQEEPPPRSGVTPAASSACDGKPQIAA